MLKMEAIASVYYTCTLSDEDEQKILQVIQDNPEEFEFMSDKEKILRAASILYTKCEIDLYKDAVESDFSTEELNWSEYEERQPEEIMETKEQSEEEQERD